MVTSLVLVLALVSMAPLPPAPGPVCSAATGEEASAVAVLRGEYGVLGSSHGRPFTGRLTLSGTDDPDLLSVSGTVDGSPRDGTARYVECGPDRLRQLEVALAPDQQLYCVTHSDYDNAHRASCSRTLSDPHGDHELWVRRKDP